ncbi:MAG: folate family ECF transporter S component [Clostridiales bacterium]|nr:folate family ECF transporter S component [Clostridiales bacterium]MDD7487098.1 folate family ECF transporter S component [Clostridiales bacterium]MDY2690306.1 folate family ECF transporter S component [Oscillospiraceae bacterium]
MSKNQSAAIARSHARSLKNVRTLVISAVLAAISVVLARLIIPMPDVSTRFSLEAVPIFLAGMFFGPIPGALVGFSADLVGCLFSGYGYNPLFCVPPILYGLSAGLFRPMLARKTNPLTIGLAFLPAIVFGSILYQSWSLAFVYGGDAFEAFFLTKLASRSLQFGITFVLDVLIVWLLYKAKVFSSAKLWPPVSGAQKPAREDGI